VKAPVSGEFEVSIKIRNNLIKARRVALGLSGPEAAKKARINYATWNKLEGMHESPLMIMQGLCINPACGSSVPWRWRLCIACKGTDPDIIEQWKANAVKEWSDPAKRIARFFRVAPEALWPEAVLALKARSCVRTMNAEEIGFSLEAAPEPLALPDAMMEQADVVKAVEEVLAGLTPKEARVLRQRFGFEGDPKTHRTIGEEEGVSSGRIGQIEAKALRKLRRPSFKGKIIAASRQVELQEKRWAKICGEWEES
jgi:RNA polymerase sigma factor (sigma-70 family)